MQTAVAQVPSERLPVIFCSHRTPGFALDKQAGERLANFGKTLPRPKGIVVMSAQWQTKRVMLGTTTMRELDYGVDPADTSLRRRLRTVQYPVTRAPFLATRVLDTLSKSHWKVGRDESKKLDFGAWVPLWHLNPSENCSVLQLSCPVVSCADMMALGNALSPLREEGVLIIGTGSVNANPVSETQSAQDVQINFRKNIQKKIETHLQQNDMASLADYYTPSLAPLWFCLGAVKGRSGAILIESVETLSDNIVSQAQDGYGSNLSAVWR